MINVYGLGDLYCEYSSIPQSSLQIQCDPCERSSRLSFPPEFQNSLQSGNNQESVALA